MSNLVDSIMINVIVDENGHIKLADNGKYIGMLDPGPGMSYKEIYTFLVQRSIDFNFDMICKNLNSGAMSTAGSFKEFARLANPDIDNDAVTARMKERLNKHFGLYGKTGTIIVDDSEPLMSDEEIAARLKENLDDYCVRNMYKQCGMDDSTEGDKDNDTER